MLFKYNIIARQDILSSRLSSLSLSASARKPFYSIVACLVSLFQVMLYKLMITINTIYHIQRSKNNTKEYDTSLQVDTSYIVP